MSLLKNKLTRDRSKLTEERAERIVKTIGNATKKYILDLEDEITEKEGKLEQMLDLSADARTTTKNTIDEMGPTEAKQWVAKRNNIKTELRLLRIKLDIAKEEQQELLGADENIEEV